MSNQPESQRLFRVVIPKETRIAENLRAMQEYRNPSLNRYELGLEGKIWAIFASGSRDGFTVITDQRREIPPIEGIYRKKGDGLKLVADGVAEVALVGRDVFNEWLAKDPARQGKVKLTAAFNASVCALHFAAKNIIAAPEQLAGLRIATKFPATVRRWLEEKGVEAEVVECDGEVEDTIRLGVADVACDMVQTGASLLQHGLVPGLKLYDSSAVMVEKTSSWTPEDRATADQLRERFVAVDAAMNADPEAETRTMTKRGAAPSLTEKFDAAWRRRERGLSGLGDDEIFAAAQCDKRISSARVLEFAPSKRSFG